MPKTEINIPVGTIVGANTQGPFVVKEILTPAKTDQLWKEQFNKSAPHDRGYHIQFKCGKMYWTLKTQVWKCMSPNDVGWRTCYNCHKDKSMPCRWDQQNSHSISVVPLRDADLKPGMIFGTVKLIDFAFNAKRHNYYEFECTKCGTHFFHMPPTNKSDIEGCHCVTCNDIHYKGEKAIDDYLKKHNILHQMQYTFNNCRYKNVLPFDCAVFNIDKSLKCLIEYDGEQHFKFIQFFHGDEEGFKLQQLRDKIKTDYCKQHNIPLLRIPYTEFDNINIILQKYLLTN